jgi:hypothetical protein
MFVTRVSATRRLAAVSRERNRQILTARSLLRIPSEDLVIRPFATQPELGHKTSRVSVGGGWRNNDTFEEVSVRTGYHDLLDPEPGYTPGRADRTRLDQSAPLQSSRSDAS